MEIVRVRRGRWRSAFRRSIYFQARGRKGRKGYQPQVGIAYYTLPAGKVRGSPEGASRRGLPAAPNEALRVLRFGPQEQ